MPHERFRVLMLAAALVTLAGAAALHAAGAPGLEASRIGSHGPTLTPQVPYAICPASVPPAGTSWTGAVSAIPSSLHPGQNATVSILFRNAGNSDFAVEQICVHFDWWASDAWAHIAGSDAPLQPCAATCSYVEGFFAVRAPSAVGTHTISVQVVANGTGLTSTVVTMANFTVPIEVDPPNPLPDFPVLVVLILAAVAIATVAVILLLQSRGRRGHPPPERPQSPPLR